MTSRLLSIFGVSLAMGLTPLMAQTDTVYPVTGDPVRGTVSEVTHNGVTLKVGQSQQTFAPSEIEKVLFQGDPAALTRGREFALDGQYDQALEELRGIDVGKLTREVVRQDAAYYRVLSEARVALAGKGDKSDAAKAALEFASRNRESWHFYDTAKLLGDLALSLNNHDRAITYYSSLRNAPTDEAKLEMRYLIGMAQLKKGDLEAAGNELGQVAGVSAQSVQVARLKDLARAGMSVVLARQGKPQESLELAKELIAELDPTDVELAARIYNAQAAGHLAEGDSEGAVLAYLHTHLMFSSLPDAHAEALSQLAELWGVIGHPDRAAEAKQELNRRYPGYEG